MFTVKTPCKASVHVQEVRELFRKPEILQPDQMEPLAWKGPDVEALVSWLVHDKQFSEERVRSAIEKMNNARGKATQGRLESFFKVWWV
jgi:flap endonuclease-1